MCYKGQSICARVFEGLYTSQVSCIRRAGTVREPLGIHVVDHDAASSTPSMSDEVTLYMGWMRCSHACTASKNLYMQAGVTAKTWAGFVCMLRVDGM